MGGQYLLTPSTILGVSYQGETEIKTDGSAVLFIPGMGSSSFDLDMETEWPSTLGIGLSHRLTPQTTVAADVIWTQWSKAKTQYDLLLSNPTNPAFQALLGNSLPERFPLNWRDSVAVRLGLERRLCNCRVVRAGYVYHRNPIPDETLTPFIQAILEHSLSVGYGWKAGDYNIDLGYQFMFGPDQNVGASSFIGNDFDNSTATASAHWLLASVMRRF